MLTYNTEYEFQRTSSGETVSLTATISLYKGDIPMKEYYFRTGDPNCNTKGTRLKDGVMVDVEDDSPTEDYTKSEIPDFSSLTPIDTETYIWNIPSELRTTAQPVDKSGKTPAKAGDFEIKQSLIRMKLKEDTEHINSLATLEARNDANEYDFTI